MLQITQPASPALRCNGLLLKIRPTDRRNNHVQPKHVAYQDTFKTVAVPCNIKTLLPYQHHHGLMVGHVYQSTIANKRIYMLDNSKKA